MPGLRLSRLGLGLTSPRGGGGGAAPSYVATSDELAIFIGQSNTGTQGVSGPTDLPPWTVSPRVRFYGVSTWYDYNPATANEWGPEVGYALDWLDRNANNAFVLHLFKRYEGGTPLGDTMIYEGTALPRDWSQTSGELFASTTAALNAAKTLLANAGVTYVVRDIHFHCCETDAASPVRIADWATNSAEFNTKARQLWGTADSNITAHIVKTAAPNYVSMKAKQREVVNQNARNFLIDTKDFVYSDGTHWTGPYAVIAGRAAYKLTHGGSPPEDIILSSYTAFTNSAAGSVVAEISSVCRDGKADVTYALISASANFEVVGSQLRYKSGAPLVVGTEKITIRATGASGSLDEEIDITISSQWQKANAVIDIDEANSRYFVNGVYYTSKAAMATAGVYVNNGTVEYFPGLTLPTEFTILVEGVNGPADPVNGVPQYIVGLDDGGTTNLVFMTRSLVSGIVKHSGGITNAGAAQLDTSNFGLTNAVANGAAFKAAMRVQTNSSLLAINGTAGTRDTACVIPVVNRMILRNRFAGDRSWTGTTSRTTVVSTLGTNAETAAMTA